MAVEVLAMAAGLMAAFALSRKSQKTEQKRSARVIAIFGTATDVGKSVVATALCRILSNKGFSVAPFKAQNMSNNSFVTIRGREVSRAQAVQAEAARCEVTCEMNPILLKPSSDTGCQVVLSGKAVGNTEAREYFRAISSPNSKLRSTVKQCINNLRKANYDYVIMEGAGSCAELNLKNRDLVNFWAAEQADADVILVADIEKCGVFAQVIGTIDLLTKEERKRVKGIIINKFRGDPTLFDDGVRIIQKRTKIPVLGVVPYFRGIHIDSEDALPLHAKLDPELKENSSSSTIKIAVIYLPHCSNFTDFLPLAREANVDLEFLQHRKDKCLKSYDIVIIPGTKNVRFDLEWMRNTGWEQSVLEFYNLSLEQKKQKKNKRIVGVCGGMQILGTTIKDIHGHDGAAGEFKGMGLLDIQTEMLPPLQKTLRRVKGVSLLPETKGSIVQGFEIHLGNSSKHSNVKSAFRLEMDSASFDDNKTSFEDGAVSEDSIVWGTYLHGLFDSSVFRKQFLGNFTSEDIATTSETLAVDIAERDKNYNALAEHFKQSLDLTSIRL